MCLSTLPPINHLLFSKKNNTNSNSQHEETELQLYAEPKVSPIPLPHEHIISKTATPRYSGDPITMKDMKKHKQQKSIRSRSVNKTTGNGDSIYYSRPKFFCSKGRALSTSTHIYGELGYGNSNSDLALYISAEDLEPFYSQESLAGRGDIEEHEVEVEEEEEEEEEEDIQKQSLATEAEDDDSNNNDTEEVKYINTSKPGGNRLSIKVLQPNTKTAPGVSKRRAKKKVHRMKSAPVKMQYQEEEQYTSLDRSTLNYTTLYVSARHQQDPPTKEREHKF